MIKLILLILAALFPGNAQPAEPQYIVIESDYDGTILLDVGTGIRYMRTDGGMHEINAAEKIQWTD